MAVDTRLVEGTTKLLALVGPLSKMVANILTPENTEFLIELLRKEEVKESTATLLEALDTGLLAVLLPTIGSVVGAFLAEIREREDLKKALVGMITSLSTLNKELTRLLLGPPSK